MRSSTFLAAALAMVFFIPACGLLFRCGCKMLWSGGDEMCNIHTGPAPACPWCSNQALGAMGALITVSPILVPSALSKTRRVPAWTPLALIVPGYLLAGLITFLLTSYPHFLLRGVRAMLHLPAGPLG